MKIKIKRLKNKVKLPTYSHPGDVGMDLYSIEDVIVKPGEHIILWHGFGIEFPEGYTAIIKDKSSISKAGLHTMGGVFDPGYRGEYNTHLVNLSDEPYTIEEGDKVSQLIIYPVEIAELEEVDELSKSARGEGSFGSTGKK
ncbi:MAG: dUTP diphosphatase [Patescibacteria group bacterium]|nr:dUTP diphosphatase [Patescibacteria group bacterium]